jgi:hypothetical protein
MTENKIAVLEAKSPVPTILKSVALDFNKQYYSGKRTIMDTLQLQRGWIKLIDDDYMYKYNDECFYSLYQMNLSIVPTSPTLFDLKFMIKTNACVYFKQNYLYTFITSDKSEFPLAVSNLGNETYDGVTEMVATVKISKETLSQILSRKLTVLRVQLNGSPVSPGSMNFKKSEPCVKMGGHEWLGFTINDINRIRFEDLVRKVL